ncbi:MAG: class I adenylate-forming enzyme family protein [Burkholderiales bacterium]
MSTVPSIPWSSDLRHLANRFGDRVAVNTGAATLTYQALSRLAHGLASRLHSEGIESGTPVATYLPNGLQAVWASYGVCMMGAAETPLATAYTPTELEWCLALAKTAWVVTHERHRALFEDIGCRVIAVESVTPAADAYALDPVPAELWGRIVFSSGSTGRPKAIIYTHGRRWLANLMLKATLPFSPAVGSRILLMTPFTHGAALQTYAWLDHGGEVLLLNGIDRAQVESFLASSSVDAVFAPPTVIAKLASLFPDRRFDGVRALFTGTQTLTPGLYAKARALVGPVVRVTYGKGENLNPITVLEAADTEVYYRDESETAGACLGWPASGVELAIRDETGRDVSPGETGEICIRSRHMSIGHIDAAGFHAMTTMNWHASGDLGWIDQRGRLWLAGRMADVIKTGGYKVYVQELESLLSGVPGCTQIAIATLPSDYWGEIIVAAAEGTGGTPDWQRAADERLAVIAKHKRPRDYIALDELPRNAQGKISRPAIREAILARYALEDGPYPKLTAK